MKVMLVRVGADQSVGGGSWNGPVDSQSRDFVYVAIPESIGVHTGLEKPYAELESVLDKFGVPYSPPPESERRSRPRRAEMRI